MTFFVTGQVGLTTLSHGGGFIPVLENTASRRVVASSAQAYNDAAVRRILKAKAGPAVRAPDDPDAFVDWLEK